MTDIIDIVDPADPRLDDFRDLNSVDRRPDLPSGKGLVIAEGVLVAQRMLASRFAPHALLGTERRRAELDADLAGVDIPYYRASAEVMAEVVGFHLNRGVLAAARRPAELTVPDVVSGARTIAVLEGVNDHENLGSIFRNAAGSRRRRGGIRRRLRRSALPPGGPGVDGPCPAGAVRQGGALARRSEHAAGQRFPAAGDDTRPGRRSRSHRRCPPCAETKLAILVGAEGPGLTETAMRASDLRVRIPMARGTDSLNVATAAALAFYERARAW